MTATTAAFGPGGVMLAFMDDTTAGKILALHREGRSVRAIAAELGLSRSAVHRVTSEDADRLYMAKLVDEVFLEDGRLNKDSRLYKLTFVVDEDRLAMLETRIFVEELL